MKLSLWAFPHMTEGKDALFEYLTEGIWLTSYLPGIPLLRVASSFLLSSFFFWIPVWLDKLPPASRGRLNRNLATHV
jgi:hypothetical protein